MGPEPNPIVHKVTSQVIQELREETSSGGLKIDALAVELIAALGHDHMEILPFRQPLEFAKGMLDT